MSAEVRLRPLSGPWPYPQTANRRTYQFRSTWEDTKALLASEAELLGARLVVVEFDVQGGEAAFRIDGNLRANAKAGPFPGARVSMETRHGPLTYASDRYERTWAHQKLASWQANVRAIAMSLEALRAVDRHGVTRRGEQYAGWKALPPGRPVAPTAPTMTADEAARVLLRLAAVDELHPADVVRAPLVYVRDLFADAARRVHPDAGGDAEDFKQLVAARDLLLAGAA